MVKKKKILPRIEFVYAGQQKGKDGMLQTYWSEERQDYFAFKGKLLGYESIGAVLSAGKDGSSFVKTAYERMSVSADPWNDKITEWSAQQRVLSQERQIRSEAGKKHPKSVEGLVKKLQDSIALMSRRQRGFLCSLDIS